MFILSAAAFDFWLAAGFSVLIGEAESGIPGAPPAAFWLVYLLTGAALAAFGFYAAAASAPLKRPGRAVRAGLAMGLLGIWLCFLACRDPQMGDSLRWLAAGVCLCYNGSLLAARAAAERDMKGPAPAKAPAVLEDILTRIEDPSERMFREIRKTEVFLAGREPVTGRFREDLSSVLRFSIQTEGEGFRLSPYIAEEAANLLETYRRVASHPSKTERTFAVMAEVEKAWHGLADAARGLYEQSMEELLVRTCVDAKVMLFKCETGGLAERRAPELTGPEAWSGEEAPLPAPAVTVRGLDLPPEAEE